MVDVLLIADMYCTYMHRTRGGVHAKKKKYVYDCHHVIIFFLV